MKHADVIRKVCNILGHITDEELRAAKPVNTRWEIVKEGSVIDSFFARTDLPSTPWHLSYCNGRGEYRDTFIQLRKANEQPNTPAI